MTEIATKLTQVRALMAERKLDGILIQRTANFAWLTNGAASYVNIASSTGAANILITPEAHYVITNVIEAPRLEAEEELAALGFRFLVGPWHESHAETQALLNRLRLGSDAGYPGAEDVSADLAQLRLSLTPTEIAQFRQLGAACAQAMNEAIRQVRPGMTELAIAGLLSQATYAAGAVPIVNLIATDERIFRYRHPLPTDKKMDHYAMLVLCGRQRGLVASITRLVHFGPLPDELRVKQDACARVDATFIARTRPGARLRDVFWAGVEAYSAAGFPDEWQLHHQGGPAGYEPRELIATPGAPQAVHVGQVYAWNPSITGVKSEDTILVGEQDNEVLTAIPDWPMITVEVGNTVLQRPAILVC
ncbi:MAG: M24 family metallopeptidase [Anaerolineae bacterium]|nr:M24 family metallopeptidase [Anaerolineae bacterium]